MIYKRNCPNCGNEIEYKNPRSFKWAERDGKVCRKCYSIKISDSLKKGYESGEIKINPRKRDSDLSKPYTRNCPSCDNEMRYVSKNTLNTAKKRNTICNSCSSYKYKKTFKYRINDDSIKKMRATKAGFSSWDDYLNNYPKKEMYKREVWKLTYKNPLHELDHWNKRGLCGVDGAYQLDHITSINYGWENKLPPCEIAKWDNLKMIPWRDNLKKRFKQD